MAILARKTPDSILHALVAAHNASVRAAAIVSTSFHADVTAKTVSSDYRAPVATSAAITSANASDLPTLLTLCAELAVVHALHVGDGATAANCNCGAHKVPDTTNVLANAAPTDLATAITFLNDAKTKFNTHIGSTTFHYNADATNTIAAANASDQATSNTLANAYKTAFNAHIASAQASVMVKLVGP